MKTASCLILAILVCSLQAPLAGQQPAAPVPQFTHPLEITNWFLPLANLKQDILVSKNGRVERTVRPALQKTFAIGDQTVPALVVEDREYENGALIEVALDYFAQGDDGAVYYLGEDVDEYKDGKISGHSGAWLYGKHTQRLGVMMPPQARAGDKFKPEDVPGITIEDDEVVGVNATVKTPSGTYKHCLEIKEKLSDGGTEYKFYAPDVGCVKESEPDAQFLLSSHQAK